MKRFLEATLSGWISRPGEIVLKLETPTVIQVYQMSVNCWRARIKGCRGDLKGMGNNTSAAVAQSVEQRFREILEPWKWRDEHGQPVDSPLSVTTHYVNQAVDKRATALHGVSLCGLVADSTKRFRGPVTCPECLTLYVPRPEIVEPTKIKTSKAGRMHVRSVEGPQHGSVETLCGNTVLTRRTVAYSAAMKNQGAKITCQACQQFVDDALDYQQKNAAIHQVL